MSSYPLIAINCGRDWYGELFFGIVFAPWPIEEQKTGSAIYALLNAELTFSLNPFRLRWSILIDDPALRKAAIRQQGEDGE